MASHAASGAAEPRCYAGAAGWPDLPEPGCGSVETISEFSLARL